MLWIRKSRQAVRGNNDRDVVTERKKIFRLYSSAVGILTCYCILILVFDGAFIGVAIVVSEMWILRKVIIF